MLLFALLFADVLELDLELADLAVLLLLLALLAFALFDFALLALFDFALLAELHALVFLLLAIVLSLLIIYYIRLFTVCNYSMACKRTYYTLFIFINQISVQPVAKRYR